MQRGGRYRTEVEGRNGGEKGGETLVGMQYFQINIKERIKEYVAIKTLWDYFQFIC